MAIALITTDLNTGFLGHTRDLNEKLLGMSILEHTLHRAERIEQIDQIVLVHAKEQTPLAGVDVAAFKKPVESFAVELPAQDATKAMLAVSRAWCMTGWRGGLGSSCIFDEILPARPLMEAMTHYQQSSAVLLRADWCLFDPALASETLARHLEAPDDMKVTFSQAAPGLGVVATTRQVLAQFDEHRAGFGQALGYNPRHAAADPVGKDVCVPVDVQVRDAYQRFVYDTPKGQQLIRQLARDMGESLLEADALAVAEAAQVYQQDQPRYATLELTPKRTADGPLIPQHYVEIHRPDMTLETARPILKQLGEAGDMPVIFGGLGDALLHPQWEAFVQLANEAGVCSIAIETDLLCDRATLEKLIALPVDVISIRLNADTAAVYEKLMGVAGFDQVIENIKALFDLRHQAQGLVPWIVPKLVKTVDNLKDMEGFFDRWKMIAGHAVIERAWTGQDAQGNPYMPDLSPVPMTPPTPVKWPTDHLVIHSDGTRAADQQDWLGERACLQTT